MLLSLRPTDITYVPGAMLIIPDLHPIGGERRLNSRLVPPYHDILGRSGATHLTLKSFVRLAAHTQLLPVLESGEETLVGGQAVIEGVMMRAPHSYCVAVRKPNGEIGHRRVAAAAECRKSTRSSSTPCSAASERLARRCGSA